MLNLFLKRMVDILGSLLGIIVFFPIFVMVAIAIKLESPGPIFADMPSRVGREGKIFRMYKFRSMIKNAHEVLRTDKRFKKFYEEYKKNNFKIETDKDPRITKVGRFIRKTSLDELPQLINILKGEMSMVGPRAFHSDELKEQQNRYPNTRKLVKTLLGVRPGLTGLWQISGRSAIDFPKRVELDAEYARKRSIFRDLKILITTIPAVFRGEGN